MNIQSMTIGFIGLGRMGSPMAQNLLKAGYSVKVYDIDPEKITALVELGAQSAVSPANAVSGVEVAISMILDDAVLDAIALGPDGILPAAQKTPICNAWAFSGHWATVSIISGRVKRQYI